MIRFPFSEMSLHYNVGVCVCVCGLTVWTLLELYIKAIDVITQSACKGIDIKSTPVTTLMCPKAEGH